MRKLHVLLQLVLDKAINYKYKGHGYLGLCEVTSTLRIKGKLTFEESVYIDNYVYNLRVKAGIYWGYSKIPYKMDRYKHHVITFFWKPSHMGARINWLKKHIKITKESKL